MNAPERQDAMEESDSLPELLSHVCDVEIDKARDLQSKINSLENFFEDHGFSRGKPRKMAMLYVLMIYGHTPRTVEKWWGKTDSSYESFSNDLGKGYLEEIKKLINEEAEYDEDTHWTPGDRVYEADEDPIYDYFDIEDEGRNAKITSFGN